MLGLEKKEKGTMGAYGLNFVKPIGLGCIILLTYLIQINLIIIGMGLINRTWIFKEYFLFCKIDFF